MRFAGRARTTTQDPDTPIRKIADDYLGHLAGRSYSGKSVAEARRTILDMILMNDLESPSDILPEHLMRFQRIVASTDLARSTRSRRIYRACDFIRYLKARGLILFDPAFYIRLPKKTMALPRAILTEEEVAKVLRLPSLFTGKGRRLRAIVEVLYGTGIRRSELLHLDLYDLDTQARTLMVRQGKMRRDRVIPVPKAALRAVGEYVRRTRSRIRTRHTALFLDRYGFRMTSNALGQSIRGLETIAKGKLGITKSVTCHVFRHSIATHLVERGVDIRYVQAFLGHSSLRSTQIYTHMARGYLAREIARCHPRRRMKIRS
jgi:integrase/recombinase XerD